MFVATAEASLAEHNVTPATSKGRVLVADDELALVRAYARALTMQGYEVTIATDGLDASAQLEANRFDVVVADVHMPGMTGLELLGTARRCDGVPVILLTGAPTPPAAEEAVSSGALLYLVKPVDMRMLVQVVDHATRLRRAALLQRGLSPFAGVDSERSSLEDRFGNALATLRVAYQPIVCWKQRAVFGYEALVRTGEPTMVSPAALIAAADRMDRMRDVGRLVRARVATDIPTVPAGVRIFVNVSTAELEDPDLLAAGAPLSRHGERVVLEITERASLDDVSDVAAKMTALRSFGFRIAVDDLGAGYAGLTAFARLLPEVVKVDMSLVRNVQDEPVKRELIRHIAEMCADMGILMVAEGVESCAERDALAALGCELMQGYLFARPGPAFPAVVW